MQRIDALFQAAKKLMAEIDELKATTDGLKEYLDLFLNEMRDYKNQVDELRNEFAKDPTKREAIKAKADAINIKWGEVIEINKKYTEYYDKTKKMLTDKQKEAEALYLKLRQLYDMLYPRIPAEGDS